MKPIVITKYSRFINEQLYNAIFFKWFGDSKVVDKNGKPLIVYHGTDSDEDFHIFGGDRGIGWFTPNKKYAEKYIRDDGKLISCFLSILNPYILTLSPQEEVTLDKFIELIGIQQIRKKYTGKQYDNEVRPIYDWYNPIYTNFLDILEDNGYDGMKTIEYEKYESWLPFFDTQIKSILNDGSWDVNDGNIYS